MSRLKKVNVSIDSRIISHLGEALIDNEKVALLELIKNASDADANSCTVKIDTSYISEYGEGRIIIEDDGVGMNPYLIEKGYLRIATSIKQKYQKVSPKFKRLAQGNKGIGRLALNQLGEHVKIKTKLDATLITDKSYLTEIDLKNIYGSNKRDTIYNENLNVYHEFEINWNNYEDNQDSVESVNINLETKSISENINIFSHNKIHGTRIEVLGLKGLSFWKNPKVSKELESDVLAFLNPYVDEKANFKVNIDLDKQIFRSSRYDKKYIQKVCESEYNFSFDQKTNEVSYEINRSRKYINQKVKKLIDKMEKYDFDLIEEIDYELLYKKLSHVKKSYSINRIENIKKNFPQCKTDDFYTFSNEKHNDNIYLPGNFSGTFYGFDFTTGVIAQEVKKLINTISGVKLYRNNFRIFPYGDKGNEWLGMSDYNARTDSVIFKSHTTTGYVDVNGELNLNLLSELTNRQGLVLDEYGSNFLTVMREIVYKNAAIEDTNFEKILSFNTEKAKKIESNQTMNVFGIEFKKRPNYRKEAEIKTENVMSGIVNIKKNLNEKDLFTNQEITNISNILEGEVVNLKNDLKLIEKEFLNKEIQVKDKEKFILDMYPIIGASIVSETLAHEIIRLSNNIKSYTKKIRSLIGNKVENEVTLNLNFIDSDIKFLARYASLLDVNSYSKRRRFEKTNIKQIIEEIIKDSPLLNYKNMSIKYQISGIGFESTIVKDSFKIIIENLLINSTYWLERNSIDDPLITFYLDIERKELIIFDNGIGINLDVSRIIFEPFITNKPEGEGRGMGLYIVSKLLEEIGATIKLSAQKNVYKNQYKFIISFAEDNV